MTETGLLARSEAGLLPNLVVIGAAKCGTTSLHYYLAQHPEIAMSTPKELRLFWRPDWRERLDWYRGHFSVDAPVRGESTPGYTLYPSRRDVAERMHSVIPGARLIYIVRDPVDRLVSHWAQVRADSRRRQFDRWVPRLSLEEAVANRDAPDNAVVWGSRYATQLERYLRLYPDEQVLVIDYDEFAGRRARTLGEVFRFLGVEEGFESPAFGRRLNTRAEKRELTGLGAPLWNYVLWPVGRRLPKALRRPFAEPLKRAVQRPVEAPASLEPAMRARLAEVLQPEADRLRELTGKPFATWSL